MKNNTAHYIVIFGINPIVEQLQETYSHIPKFLLAKYWYHKKHSGFHEKQLRNKICP